MKPILGALCSFLIPGLGQLFYGHLGWAILWLALACGFGPLVNVLSAIHVIFISTK
jgi:TM2 domain-containing membrane protein YozV